MAAATTTDKSRGYPDSSLVTVKVTPGASRNELAKIEGETIHLKIAAPAEKGKANRELIAFLSRCLGVSKSSVTILKGLTGRHKTLSIQGLSRDEILARLSS